MAFAGIAAVFSISSILLTIQVVESSPDGWTRVNSGNAFSRRASPHGINANGIFILTGGRNGTDTMHNDIWRSDDQGVSWKLVTKEATWSPRAYHFCVFLNDSIFVMGGQGGDGLFEFFDDIWKSDDFGITWHLVTEHAPWGKRAGGYAFVYEDEIYLMAGANCNRLEFPCNLDGKRNYFDDIWKSADGQHWEQIATGIPCMKREGIIVVPQDGVFYAFGGDNGFNGPYFNDVWISKDKGKTWTELVEHADWSERTGHVAVSVGEYIVMIGGYPDLTDIWRSRDGKKWELVSENAWNCRSTSKICGKFDFEFFVDNTTGEHRIYTVAGDQEVYAPFPQDNDVWFYHNSSLTS